MPRYDLLHLAVDQNWFLFPSSPALKHRYASHPLDVSLQGYAPKLLSKLEAYCVTILILPDNQPIAFYSEARRRRLNRPLLQIDSSQPNP